MKLVMRDMFFQSLYRHFHFIKFVFIISLVASAEAKQYCGAAVTVIADHPRKHIPVVLFAKQLELFGGKYLNFGGFAKAEEDPSVCAAQQLACESLSFYKITPEELKNAPYVDIEKRPGYFFRNYFIYSEHVPISKIVAVLKKMHIDSEYRRADYRACKVREFNGDGCKIIKKVHDYVESDAFVWIPLKDLLDHILDKKPLVGKIGICIKPGGQKSSSFYKKRDFEGKDYASLSILRIQSPVLLRNSFVEALSTPEAITLLKAFLNNTIKAPHIKAAANGASYSELEEDAS
jgi:hypothetical protein